jgi:ABC-type multidrug transport system fused ATPase/permease subunit
MIQATLDFIGSQGTGMSIVTIAHRLSTVRNSDVIYVLQAGQVAEFGSHDELKDKPGGLYSALAAAQAIAGEGEKEGEKSVGPDPIARTTSAAMGKDAKDSSARLSKGKAMSKAGTKGFETDEEKEREKKIAKEYKVPTMRILRYARAQWWWFVPATLGAIVNGSMFPAIGATMLAEAMTAFSYPDKEKMKDELTKVAIIFACGGVALFFANTLQTGGFGVIGENIVRNVRVNLMRSVMQQEIGFHDDPAYTPTLLSKAFQVYANRMQRICVSMGDKANAITALLAGCVVAFYYAWQMAGAMFLAGPFLVVAQSIQMVAQMGGAQEKNGMLDKAQQVLGDAITNARTVMACGSEMQVVKLYGLMIKGLSKGATKKHLIGAFGFGVSDAMQYFVMAFGFWFLGWLIDHGHTDFNDGLKAFMGLLFGAFSMGMAAAMIGNMAAASVAAHDMFELIDRQPLINGLEPTGNTPPNLFDCGYIELREVQFFYPFRPDVQVLKGLSFQVQSGQSVGLAGPSGGGKSTVMAMIQRFYDPQEGEVLLGAKGSQLKLKEQNIRWWRKQIGFVGQEPILFEGTVLDNVKYGIEEGKTLDDARLQKCKEMSILGFIDKANGWKTEVGPRGSRLSGGQKQRVAICRGLVRNPAVLMLDEATSALDSQSEKIVSKALELAREGRTSFAIAHRLSTIQDCDVIMVVGEGRILEKGSNHELMELNGVYSKLVSQSQHSGK